MQTAELQRFKVRCWNEDAQEEYVLERSADTLANAIKVVRGEGHKVRENQSRSTIVTSRPLIKKDEDPISLAVVFVSFLIPLVGMIVAGVKIAGGKNSGIAYAIASVVGLLVTVLIVAAMIN